ncbi:hypothetical protein PR002_g32202 [Phytophthora rubi]|uniref:BED-type domain-containing protein n=1 Tax=Phytophthora rubi TaxID=129364 RepID=A0A6A3G6B6_9STRA|nr:hypothetical protein PR002_g32202 [Phytophthora rubi]
MPGGRPKSQVWQLFDEHADGVKCKRCPAAIVNPKPLKLESHLAKCSGYTLLEKNKRKHVSEEREEERVRRNSRDNGAAVTLSPSGDGSATLQGVSQAEMEMRIANFVYESGSAFRIVELPSFTFMMNGANPVLTIPSAKKVGDELLTASFEQHTEKNRI